MLVSLGPGPPPAAAVHGSRRPAVRCYAVQTATSTSAPPKNSPLDIALQLGVTQGTSFRLSQQMASRPEGLSLQSLKSVQATLKLPMEEWALICAKEPSMLALPVEQLDKTLVVLQKVLGGLTRTAAAQQVLVTCPGLLAMRADAVQQQFDALVQGLGVEAALVSRLICRLPRVLETLQVVERCRELRSMLGMSPEEAVELLATYPPLVVEDPAKLQRRINALCGVLQAENAQVCAMVRRYPPILITHEDITDAQVCQLSETLSADRGAVVRLVLAMPAIVTVPQNLVASHFAKLDAVLGHGGGREAVIGLVAANPSLLGLKM